MSTSVQFNLPPVLVEPSSRSRESAPPRQGDKSSLTELLAKSCEETGLSEKDAAMSQGYDPKYWPRVKSGEKAAHLEKIAGLPEKTQQEFLARWGRQLGMHLTTEDTRRRVVANLVKAAAEALAEIA